MIRRLINLQLMRFAVVGVASTVLNLVLFALLAQVMSHQPANALALILCTIANTAVNRRYTFGVQGSDGRLRVQLQSLALLAVTWSVTALALLFLEHQEPNADTWVATVTVAIGNLIATIVRFVLLRRWFAHVSDETGPLAQAA